MKLKTLKVYWYYFLGSVMCKLMYCPFCGGFYKYYNNFMIKSSENDIGYKFWKKQINKED